MPISHNSHPARGSSPLGCSRPELDVFFLSTTIQTHLKRGSVPSLTAPFLRCTGARVVIVGLLLPEAHSRLSFLRRSLIDAARVDLCLSVAQLGKVFHSSQRPRLPVKRRTLRGDEQGVKESRRAGRPAPRQRPWGIDKLAGECQLFCTSCRSCDGLPRKQWLLMQPQLRPRSC